MTDITKIEYYKIRRGKRKLNEWRNPNINSAEALQAKIEKLPIKQQAARYFTIATICSLVFFDPYVKSEEKLEMLGKTDERLDFTEDQRDKHSTGFLASLNVLLIPAYSLALDEENKSFDKLDYVRGVLEKKVKKLIQIIDREWDALATALTNQLNADPEVV